MTGEKIASQWNIFCVIVAQLWLNIASNIYQVTLGMRAKWPLGQSLSRFLYHEATAGWDASP